MPLAHSTEPSLLPTERPRCPKCQGRMMLARIGPGPNGSDLRTFECPKCEHVEKQLVEDPMNSASRAGRTAGLRRRSKQLALPLSIRCSRNQICHSVSS